MDNGLHQYIIPVVGAATHRLQVFLLHLAKNDGVRVCALVFMCVPVCVCVCVCVCVFICVWERKNKRKKERKKERCLYRPVF